MSSLKCHSLLYLVGVSACLLLSICACGGEQSPRSSIPAAGAPTATAATAIAVPSILAGSSEATAATGAPRPTAEPRDPFRPATAPAAGGKLGRTSRSDDEQDGDGGERSPDGRHRFTLLRVSSSEGEALVEIAIAGVRFVVRDLPAVLATRCGQVTIVRTGPGEATLLHDGRKVVLLVGQTVHL